MSLEIAAIYCGYTGMYSINSGQPRIASFQSAAIVSGLSGVGSICRSGDVCRLADRQMQKRGIAIVIGVNCLRNSYLIGRITCHLNYSG